jgi:hypothetical protein
MDEDEFDDVPSDTEDEPIGGIDTEGQATSPPPDADGPSAGDESGAGNADPHRELRNKVREQGEENKRLRPFEAAYETWQRNPDWTYHDFQEYLQGGTPGTNGTKKESGVDAILGRIEDVGSREVLSQLVTALRDEVRKEVEGKIQPIQRATHRTQAEIARERGYRSAGLAASDVESEEFREFEEEFAADNRGWFGDARSRDPEGVAKLVAERWQGRRNARNGNVAARDRLREARESSTSAGGGRTGPGSESVEMPRHEANMVSMFRLIDKGKTPKLVEQRR